MRSKEGWSTMSCDAAGQRRSAGERERGEEEKDTEQSTYTEREREKRRIQYIQYRIRVR